MWREAPFETSEGWVEVSQSYAADAEHVFDRDLSASQIKKHKSCPMQYWFRYATGIEGSKPESGYLVFGSAIHDAIEEYMKAEREGVPPDTEEELLARMGSYCEQYEVPDERLGDLETCAASAARWFNKHEETPVRDVEKRLKYDIDRPDFSTRMTAIMDVATETEIWDWKTGSIRDGIGAEEKIQGMVYAGAFRAEYGRYPEKVRFLYLKEEEVRSIEPNDKNWRFMLKHVRRLIEDREDGSFEADPGDQCYWCDWEYFCPASGAGAGDLDWEDLMTL